MRAPRILLSDCRGERANETSKMVFPKNSVVVVERSCSLAHEVSHKTVFRKSLI